MSLATIPAERLRLIDAALGWVPERHQMAPPGDWTYWLFIAGRGAGKTDAGAHYVNQHAEGPPCIDGAIPHRIAIAAPTLGDARLTCVKGDSGILQHNPGVRFLYTDGELYWPNGSHGRIFGAYTPEDVERWRGPQHCLIWADEFAAWRQLDECWKHLIPGFRLGEHPRMVITTTPRPLKLVKDLMKRPDAQVTRGSTRDNAKHLAASVIENIYNEYKGTRYERQELDGEVVDQVEGALWTEAMLAGCRDLPPLTHKREPDMRRIVVAVDPSVTGDPTSDETGIVVAGVDRTGLGWVLEDRSMRGSPSEWASAVVRAYHRWEADRIIAESNNGGEMIALTIHAVDPSVPVKLVNASRSKQARAEPVVAKYEQGRVKHMEGADLAKLEEQLTTWVQTTGAPSPDRLDALVWALTELMLAKGWGAIGADVGAVV